MCLIISNTQDTFKTFQAQPNIRNLTIKVWKVFGFRPTYIQFKTCDRVSGGFLTGPYRTGYRYNVGLHTAKPDTNFSREVHAGLHVCLNEAEALKISNSVESSSCIPVIIPFEVTLDKVHSVGRFSDYRTDDSANSQAVVTELNLTQEKYDIAIAEAMAYMKKKYPHLFPGKRIARS